MIEKLCQNCGELFICRADDILNCQCSKVQISERTKSEIAKKFQDCLCVNCLIDFEKARQSGSDLNEYDLGVRN
jgi:hypothetical protein